MLRRGVIVYSGDHIRTRQSQTPLMVSFSLLLKLLLLLLPILLLLVIAGDGIIL